MAKSTVKPSSGTRPPKKPRIFRHKAGKRADLGNIKFRSKWEANYARYLKYMEAEGRIISWAYEPKRFDFPGKNSNSFYIPDFAVLVRFGGPESDDYRTEYHEVKAYMDGPSKTKLRRMAKYFPDSRVIVIGKESYRQIEDDMCKIISEWE